MLAFVQVFLFAAFLFYRMDGNRKSFTRALQKERGEKKEKRKKRKKKKTQKREKKEKEKKKKKRARKGAVRLNRIMLYI